jgi:hypothetical protein
MYVLSPPARSLGAGGVGLGGGVLMRIGCMKVMHAYIKIDPEAFRVA